MDRDLVRKILAQISGGNSVFNTLSSDTANALGISVETPRTDEEASNLRYHLDELGRQGLIKILFVSAAHAYTADLTFQGRDLLRKLGG